jgi:hypothetical protein
VIVAMVAVRMVKVAIDEIVDVVAVRDGLMSASRPVHMPRLVSCATVIGRAAIRVLGRHFNDVLVDVIGMRVVQMPVVQVVDMIAVAHRRMSAGGAMLMCMIGMMRLGALCHRGLALRSDHQATGWYREATAVRFLFPDKPLNRRRPVRPGPEVTEYHLANDDARYAAA